MDMSAPLVSLVIPVYKVELYLRTCIESVLAQTYSNWETILVDDGSPDRCGEICEEYASSDPRIKLIHQANRGLSGARNTGLDMARGKYIVFSDADAIEQCICGEGDGSLLQCCE